MSIYIGNNKYKEIYLGSTKISEVYLGSNKIFSGAEPSKYEEYRLKIYDDYYRSMTTMAFGGIYYNGDSSSDVVPLANIPLVECYDRYWTKTTLTSSQIDQARQPNVGLTLTNVMSLEMKLSGFTTTPNNISVRFTSGFTVTTFVMQLWGYNNSGAEQTLLYSYPKGTKPAGTYTFNISGN